MDGPTATAFRSSVVPSPKDWDDYRETIIDLYIKRKMSLPRLIMHMRSEHGFNATEKMYKMRFTQWKIRKNVTKKRALDAAERSLACIFGPEGNLAAAKKCQEYFRRLPEDRRTELLNTILQPLISNKATANPTSFAPPADMLVQERYIYLLSSYVRGSSEAKRWPRDTKNGFKNEDTVPAWCSSVMSASAAFKNGKKVEAMKFLQQFIKQSPEQLSREDPLLFSFVYTSVLFFATSRPDVAQWLLKALHNVSEKLPWAGSSHPLRLLLQVMLRIGPANIIVHAKSIILAYINMIYEALGAVYPIVQDMISDTIWRLLRYKLMSPEEVANLGRRVVVAAELQRQDQCKDHLNLKMHLAGAYLEAGNHREARSTAESITDARYADIRSERMMPSLYMLISRISEAEDRQDEAIESALRAVVESRKVFGDWSDWTVNSLDFYHHLLKRTGRMDKVQRVVEDFDLAIKELCNKSERLVVCEGASVV